MPTSGDAYQPNILTVPNGAIVPESSLGGEKNKKQKILATIGSGGLNVSFLTTIKLKYKSTTQLIKF